MFGFRKAILAMIRRLEGFRIDHEEMIHEGNITLVQFRAELESLKMANEELVARVAELESRQNTIRDGLQAAVVKPTPLLDTDTIGVGTLGAPWNSETYIAGHTEND